MASGATHGRVTRTLALPAFLIGYFISDSFYLGFLAMIGCLAGLYLEPDLDIKLVTASERRLKKIPVLGNLWYFIWLPYANFLPHRSMISHLPIISTAIRYLYLFTFLIPVWLMLNAVLFLDPEPVINFFTENWVDFAYIFFGNALADYGHFTLDVKWVVLSNGKIKFL